MAKLGLGGLLVFMLMLWMGANPCVLILLLCAGGGAACCCCKK
jgi:hypothetical protein